MSGARGRDGEASEAQYAGRYGQAGSPGLVIEATDDGLSLRMPGAPPGAATPLFAAGPDRFAMGAPGAGAELRFERDGEGTIAALSLAGGLSLPPHPDTDPPDYVVGPEPAEDPALLQAFEALHAREVAPGDGRVIDYALDAPRSQFLAYLCLKQKLLVHGSNAPDIDEFSPERRTLGRLAGQSDSGVSACSDALWAMAYAVLDRSRMRGAFHNVALPFRAGASRGRLYHFSIAREILAESPPPFTDGTVYVLSREGFARLPGAAGLEWACPHAVRPLARLRVSPQDFPLLDRVRGHDDRAAHRYLERRNALFEECTRAERHADGYTLCFAPRPGLTREVFAFCESLRVRFAWVDLRVHAPPEPGEVTLTVRGSTGLLDRLDARLAGKLDGDAGGPSQSQPPVDRDGS